MADVTGLTYAADAVKGTLAQWLIGDGASPETFEAVYAVRRIVPGGHTTARIDKTHLRSPDNHTEKTLGRRDTGDWTFEVIYNPDHESHTNTGGGSGSFTGGGLFAMHVAGTERNMLIRYGAGSPQREIAFRGAVADIQMGEIIDSDVIMLNVTVAVLQDYSADLP